jgi:hypothetical protein
MFIRKRGGSHQLIETYRDHGKVKQRQIANLGPCETIADAIDYWERELARMVRGCSPREVQERQSWWSLKIAKRNLTALRSVKIASCEFDTTGGAPRSGNGPPPTL